METYEYFDSEEQMFWEGHLIKMATKEEAIAYSAKYGRDTGFCSHCHSWVDRDAHFDRDLRCLIAMSQEVSR